MVVVAALIVGCCGYKSDIFICSFLLKVVDVLTFYFALRLWLGFSLIVVEALVVDVDCFDVLRLWAFCFAVFWL